MQSRRMKAGSTVGNLVALAVVGVGIYAFLNWDSVRPQGDENSSYAERVCVAEISSRYSDTAVNPYSIKKTRKGYVVRASITLPNGKRIKAYCLTNDHGGVEEIRIEEQ